MPRRFWIAALSVWPGLAQVWVGQELLGLAFGLSFASALNLALISRFVWPEAFVPGWAAASWAAAACWLFTLTYTLVWVYFWHPSGRRAEIDRLYRDATDSYLRGRFGEARSGFERIVEMDDGDADAWMRLGTLFVRTEQLALARRAFRQCLEREGGAKWRWEIDQAWARSGRKPADRA